MPNVQPDFQRFVDRLTSRSVLSAEEQQAILDLPSHAVQVRPNTDFVALGDTVDHASFIVDGFVGRFDQNFEGKRQITAIHIPGEIADLHSVVQPTVTSALQALSVATILRVPHVALRAAAARFPHIAEALWRDCAVDAAILAQWVVNVGRRDARTRVAHLVCEIATRLGVAPAEGVITFPFPVTQVQLADATGLTAVHINRSLRALKEDALLDYRHRRCWITDWEALANVDEFDATYLQVNIRPENRLRSLQPRDRRPRFEAPLVTAPRQDLRPPPSLA